MLTPIKDRFLNIHLINQGRRKNTIDTYSIALNQLYSYFSELLKIKDEKEMLIAIDNDMIEDYIADMKKKYAVSTINNRINCWITFFTYVCVNKKIIPSNPLDGVPIIENKFSVEEKDILDRKELRELLNATYIKNRQERMFEFNSTRDRFIIAFQYTTGARICEILNMKFEWLDKIDDGYMVNIPEAVVKNHFDKRLPIQYEVLKYFNEYIEQRDKLDIDSEYVLVSARGGILGRSDWNSNLEKILNKAKIEKHITSHCARHYFVTELKLAGVSEDIMNRIGGWKMDSVKEKYYCYDKAFDEEKIKVCNSLL